MAANSGMVIGIVGAGALGALYGGYLAAAGENVRFLMRSDWQVARRDGLRIIRPDRTELCLPIAAFSDAESVGPCDIVLVGLKSSENRALDRLLAPVTHERSVVLTLQNGLGNEEAIAAALSRAHGGDRRSQVVGGVAFLCSYRMVPAVIDHISQGNIKIAEFVGPAQPRTREFGAMFERAGVGCQVADSLLAARWEKLVWNIPFNGMSVAADHADTEAMLADDELQALVRGCMEEAVAAARADGIELPASIIDRMISTTLTIGPYKTSMLLDYEARRSMEVEAILGEPMRRARAAGIPVPRMQALYAIVRRMNARLTATANR
jgi:2-dehydropantoate 2-reductase